MVTLQTGLGTIEGVEVGGAIELRGIRYAEPPVGERRFRPPVRTGAWSGTYDGTTWGCRSVQNPTPAGLGGEEPGEIGEDCLVLNVTVPAAVAQGDLRPRPVLCWIHGGAFTIGSGNDYPAHELVRREDLVVVTVSYRLGALGFLDLSGLDESYAGSANLGIADQIAALGWIHDHIADFGGDPEQVTIAGESAGAISVMSLLASPSADGLYRRAMANSTGGFTPADTRAHVLPLFDQALAGDGPLLDRLRAASTDELLQAQVAAGFGFGSTVDGTVVTRSMDEAVARAAEGGVPLLIGSNADEGTLFLAIGGGDAGVFDVMTAGLPAAVAKGGDVERYRALLTEAFPEEDPAGDGGVARNLRIWNHFFRRPAVESAALATERGAGGWLYRFELPSTAFGGALGANHAGEIAFTFDWLAGDGDTGWTFHDRSEAHRAVARAWSSAVARFVRTGDPNGPDLPEWPRYATDDRRVLIIDDPLRVEVDPDEADRKLWESLD